MRKGIYSLIIYLNKERIIKIGKLGSFLFKKGFYIYTGSSQNSLQKRVVRHLSSKKRFHWHIDYLLKYGKILNVKVTESSKQYECKLSKEIGLLSNAIIPIKGFGSSDCACKTHLYFFKKSPIPNIDTCNNPTSILGKMKIYEEQKYFSNLKRNK